MDDDDEDVSMLELVCIKWYFKSKEGAVVNNTEETRETQCSSRLSIANDCGKVFVVPICSLYKLLVRSMFIFGINEGNFECVES